MSSICVLCQTFPQFHTSDKCRTVKKRMTKGAWPREKCNIILTLSDYSTLLKMKKGSWLRQKCDIILNLSDYWHTSIPLRSVELSKEWQGVCDWGKVLCCSQEMTIKEKLVKLLLKFSLASTAVCTKRKTSMRHEMRGEEKIKHL